MRPAIDPREPVSARVRINGLWTMRAMVLLRPREVRELRAGRTVKTFWRSMPVEAVAIEPDRPE